MKDRVGNTLYALFSDHARWSAMACEDYEEAQKIARSCRCGICDCCRAAEYVTEALAQRIGA